MQESYVCRHQQSVSCLEESLAFLSARSCNALRSPLPGWCDIAVAQQPPAICIGTGTQERCAGWQGLDEMPRPGLTAHLQISDKHTIQIQTSSGLSSALHSETFQTRNTRIAVRMGS